MGDIIEIEGFSVPVGTHKGKTIYIAADHRGFEYKKRLVGELEGEYLPVTELGTFSPERTDYPEISHELGLKVGTDPCRKVGIGICGSGIGILIPASKHRGVYPARCLNPKEAETSRMHNNTNVLGIGADYPDFDTALETVKVWLETPFYSDPKKEESYLQRYIQTLNLTGASPEKSL